MFKFLKSKKGFTLVELMIVVVIMAILVAVAVPIYSAVTKNARKKTCLANQREIVSQIGNADMAETIDLVNGDEFTITTANDKGDWTVKTGVTGSTVTKDQLTALFQKAPYCPVNGNKIVVSITAANTGAEEDGWKITTVCTAGAGNDEVHS